MADVTALMECDVRIRHKPWHVRGVHGFAVLAKLTADIDEWRHRLTAAAERDGFTDAAFQKALMGACKTSDSLPAIGAVNSTWSDTSVSYTKCAADALLTLVSTGRAKGGTGKGALRTIAGIRSRCAKMGVIPILSGIQRQELGPNIWSSVYEGHVLVCHCKPGRSRLLVVCPRAEDYYEGLSEEDRGSLRTVLYWLTFEDDPYDDAAAVQEKIVR